jgi:hypothetical protein
MVIHQIIYQSTAARALEGEELGRLVSQSRIFNYSESITGILFYDGIHFLQLLEGSRRSVEQLYARIRENPRHSEVTTLYNAAVPKRLFADWSLALSQPSAEALDRLAGFLTPSNQAVLLPQGYDAQDVNADLLQEFVAEYPPVAASGYYRYAGLQF